MAPRLRLCRRDQVVHSKPFRDDPHTAQVGWEERRFLDQFRQRKQIQLVCALEVFVPFWGKVYQKINRLKSLPFLFDVTMLFLVSSQACAVCEIGSNAAIC